MKLTKPYRLRQDKINGTVHIVETDHTGQPVALCRNYYPSGAFVNPSEFETDAPAMCKRCHAEYNAGLP